METNNANRVLGRRGAREVTPDEIQKVAGSGGIPTRLTEFLTGTVTNPDHHFDE